MLKNCQQCNIEFEAKRDDAKFCSSSCKMQNQRGVPKNVTDNLLNVTDNATDVTDKYPNLTANKALGDALTNLYDSFSAKELSDAGIQPPEWKKNFKTKAEAIDDAKGKLSEMGLAQNPRGYWMTEEKNVTVSKIDYSQWM